MALPVLWFIRKEITKQVSYELHALQAINLFFKDFNWSSVWASFVCFLLLSDCGQLCASSGYKRSLWEPPALHKVRRQNTPDVSREYPSGQITAGAAGADRYSRINGWLPAIVPASLHGQGDAGTQLAYIPLPFAVSFCMLWPSDRVWMGQFSGSGLVPWLMFLPQTVLQFG